MKIIAFLFSILGTCAALSQNHFSGPFPTQPNGINQLSFACTNTGAIVPSLPSVVTNADLSINYNPDSASYSNAGWRTVNQPVPTPASGIYSASQYSILDLGNGTCNLIGTNVYNQAYSLAYQITNNPNVWTLDFSNNCALFSSVIQAYQGHGAQTNANVNSWTVFSYIATNAAFASTPTNIVNVVLEYSTSQQILAIPGITNTAQFYQVLANIFH